ncbi:F-box family protein [Quillaja saponaria]|uniref:F-box family protein n=1 Tax=Quillaja saponaria TaxID=32244 RepID=A0AAD7QEN3_QUISA|nr:F-box family protein [Quillaja saponaria]
MGEFLAKKVCKKTFLQFPQDIVEEIFLKLPVKSLIRFRCLSKQCHAFIFEPGFSRLHYRKSCEDTHGNKVFVSDCKKLCCINGEAIFKNGVIADDDFAAIDVKFITSNLVHRLNSCEGLVSVYTDSHIHLWNPLTGHYKRLPEFTQGCYFSSCFGFGYDYSRDDYMIVGPVLPLEGQEHLDKQSRKIIPFLVFSLRANSWRTLNLGFTWDDMEFLAVDGKFLNGAIHWLVSNKRLHPEPPGSEKRSRLIVSFDLASEKIHDILQLPPHDPHVVKFGILEGCLCVWIDDPYWNYHVWIMKEYKEVASWTKVAVVHRSMQLFRRPWLTPMYLLENGEALVLIYEGKLSIYNLRERKIRTIFNSNNNSCFLVTRHVERLFPFLYFEGLDCEIS